MSPESYRSCVAFVFLEIIGNTSFEDNEGFKKKSNELNEAIHEN